MDQNKLLIGIVVALGIIIAGSFLAGPVVIDKLADKVIEKLQRDYAPGPYAPGFNPDQIDPNSFRRQQPNVGPGQFPQQTGFTPITTDKVDADKDKPFDFRNWNSQWEEQRRKPN